MKITDELTIQNLNFQLKTYDAVTRTIAATKNRLCHLNPDAKAKNDEVVAAMESIKGKLGRNIRKQLSYWPIWTEWLVNVPGCGEWCGGKLIMLYYYRFTPICKDCNADLEKVDKRLVCTKCGKPAKMDGVLEYRISLKDFSKVSSWWKYCGLHVEDGKKPMRKVGSANDWSTTGRVVAYQLGEQFVKQGGLYREFFDLRKAKRELTHPEASKGHRNAMAKNETAKLFFAHFIQVAKTLDGEDFTKPYAHTVMGHTNFVDPFYFVEDLEKAA